MPALEHSTCKPTECFSIYRLYMVVYDFVVFLTYQDTHNQGSLTLWSFNQAAGDKLPRKMCNSNAPKTKGKHFLCTVSQKVKHPQPIYDKLR